MNRSTMVTHMDKAMLLMAIELSGMQGQKVYRRF
jgi:hypothetical protein